MARKLSKISGVFKKKKFTEEQRIVISKHGSSPVDESYIRLKDNVLFRGENGLKVVQVVSSISGEGRSTMVGNLAVSLSFNNKKVVVLDLDFKKPKLAKIFGIEESLGIGDYLLGECDLEQIINKTENGVDVIGKGLAIQNTSFALGSDKFKELIDRLKEKYDFILLDCAPILTSSDYIHEVKVSDGVLLTVSTNFVKRSAVRDTVKLLNKISANIIGCVMTMKAPNTSTHYEDEE